jgi:hypothetical protein
MADGEWRMANGGWTNDAENQKSLTAKDTKDAKGAETVTTV